jgi:hypothetical protein
MESESQDEREARLQKLWKKLDTRDEGQIDLNGLKKGLRKMDHRGWPMLLLEEPYWLLSSLEECRQPPEGCPQGGWHKWWRTDSI